MNLCVCHARVLRYRNRTGDCQSPLPITIELSRIMFRPTHSGMPEYIGRDMKRIGIPAAEYRRRVFRSFQRLRDGHPHAESSA